MAKTRFISPNRLNIFKFEINKINNPVRKANLGKNTIFTRRKPKQERRIFTKKAIKILCGLVKKIKKTVAKIMSKNKINVPKDFLFIRQFACNYCYHLL